MKLTKKLEAEALKFYHDYWDVYLAGDIKSFSAALDDSVMIVGTAISEIFNNKKQTLKFYKDTADQMTNSVQLRNRKINVQPVSDTVIIHEQTDFYVLMDKKWIFYGHVRLSAVLIQTKKSWKLVHQHASFPDSRAEEGEQLASKKIAAENLKLREAVERRTVELKQTNRELEIETALEKVRAVAMGMKEPADMLQVCKTIALQLNSLGLKETRNVQTAIFYEDKGTYMNYEYYAKHDKTFITETSYTNHEMHLQFASQMLKGKGEFFTRHIKGKKKVADWLAYQRTTNVFIDTFLETAKSLSYYWYSLGPVALGISSYVPLTDEETNLFKRFLKVFELSYRRYLDIEKAEAQAREAQIQLALERVRARTMAMHKSSELAEAASLLFGQLRELGAELLSCGFAICKTDNPVVEKWMASPDSGKIMDPFYFRLTDLDEQRMYDAWKDKVELLSYVLEAEELSQAFKAALDIPKFGDHIKELIDIGIQLPTWQENHIAPFSHGYLLIMTRKPFEEKQVFVRFAKVFEQTYTRFLDLQKAEAQAREAKIEAALERTRTQSMIMQHSTELDDTLRVFHEQVLLLGIKSAFSFLWLPDEEKDRHIFWAAWAENNSTTFKSKAINYPLDRNEPATAQCLVDWKGKEPVVSYHVPPTGVAGYFAAWQELIDGVEQLKPEYFSDGLYYVEAFMKYGCFGVMVKNALPEEEKKILGRFAIEFERTYTRFLDLQKAEAQAREAQIEAALEKVRSRSLAMHKSEELREVVAVVFEKLQELNFLMDDKAAGILIFKEGTKDHIQWIADPGHSYPTSFNNPYTEHSLSKDLIDAKESGVDYFAKLYSFEEKNDFFNYLFEYTDYQIIPGEVKKLILATKSYGFSVAFAKNSAILVPTNSGKLLSDTEKEIIKRFVKVFDQTYTRFLDLQKAEAQAREAQIEVSLERVRARTMAMQKSDELTEVAELLFKQVKDLGIKTWTTGFNVWSEDNNFYTDYITNPQGGFVTPYTIDARSLPVGVRLSNAKKSGQEFYVNYEEGEALAETYRTLLKFGEKQFTAILESGFDFPTSQYEYFVFGSKVSLMFITYDDVSESLDIFKRFGKVFEQTYTRFLDLQTAEEQAREAQVQLALERVRARALAMHNSSEFLEVANVLREQMKLLGQPDLESSIIHLYNDASDTFEAWYAYSAPGMPSAEIIRGYAIVPKESSEWSREVISKYKSAETEYTITASGNKLKEWYHVLEKLAPATVDYDDKGQIIVPEILYYQFSNFPGGSLLMITNQPASPHALNLQKRAAVVLGLAYTRFLDLQKAEAQAREATIEASLERVRAKAMAMHKSDDLTMAVTTVFEELDKLDLGTLRCGIGIMHREKRSSDVWTTAKSGEGMVVQVSGDEFMDIHPLLHGTFETWLTGEDFSYELKGDDLNKYYQSLITTNYSLPGNVQPDSTNEEDIKHYFFKAHFQNGGLFAFRETPFPKEAIAVMKRFAAVFNLTYKRFLDLQKAEAQTRESQIELSLERVRAKTMAMHNSQDVGDTVATMFDEVVKLGIQTIRCGIGIMHPGGEMELWTAKPDENGKVDLVIGRMDMMMHPLLKGAYTSWQNKIEFYTYDLIGDDLIAYFTAINNHPDYPVKYDIASLPTKIIHSEFHFSEGTLFVFSLEKLSEETYRIFKRFAGVFGQTYRRYLDLKKAEMQAKEATVEAALEKVRGKAMAMHTSNDVSATASMVFTELRKLGINPIRSGVGLLNKESRKAQLYSATSSSAGDSLSLVGWIMLTNQPVAEKIYDAWLMNEDYYPELSGEQLKLYYENLLSGLSLPSVPDWKDGKKQYGTFLSISVGCLYAWSESPYSEGEIKILKRFGAIIDLTFRRYIELQKSEANAKEAVRQASLDRVRAEIASMRTTSDLERITPLIWNELTILGVPFIRCGVFIMDEIQQLIHTFLSTPDGKAIGAFHLPYTIQGNIAEVLRHWQQNENYITHWDEEDFTEFADILAKQSSVSSSEQYLQTIPHSGFHLHFLPFLQGMLYVGNTRELGEEEIKLVQSVANAFATAYARYEDFNKLEAAKQTVEKTLVDLRQAQTQLVQAEKMASLGQLTAGIAHEIQNPLNFVNNFSEVSEELIKEMLEEVNKGNIEEVKAIAGDLVQNLEKIYHHGKRADSIVKGMLEHSRTSTGNREPIDINALADEYLRLSYHGIRAKDKSFNTAIHTNFDTTIDKINIIGQDIGRVLLNLYNNAFYAVNEKMKSANSNYKPEVEVETRKEGNRISISVCDNGNGVPQNIVDKIFQPFFTTKPTGSGTGLGLSLAYDIVKAHGGEIKVESKEGKGSKFDIELPVA